MGAGHATFRPSATSAMNKQTNLAEDTGSLPRFSPSCGVKPYSYLYRLIAPLREVTIQEYVDSGSKRSVQRSQSPKVVAPPLL